MFFGKHKVMTVALDGSPSDECKDNLSQVSKKWRGEGQSPFHQTHQGGSVWGVHETHGNGLHWSGKQSNFHHEPGSEGPLEQPPATTMEPRQRQLGLLTALKRGVVTLLSDQEVCKEGNVLSPEQACEPELFGCEMAESKVTIKGGMHNPEGSSR